MMASVNDARNVSLSKATRNVNTHADKLKNNDFNAKCKSMATYPLYVNQYFMKLANEFMNGYARNVLGIKYYWGRVKLSSGRGQIHLHILGIAKNKAYLMTPTEQRKNKKKLM